MLKKLKCLSTEIQHANPWWEYRHDRYMRPDDSEGEFFYVHTQGSVMVIPLLDSGKIVLQNQFRYLNQKESLEFVGGGVKKGTTHAESAREELLEEAGFIVGRLEKVGEFNPFNGASDEICEVFVAHELQETAARPEGSEEFERRDVTIPEFEGLIRSGEIWDGMTLAAYTFFRYSRFWNEM